MAAEILDMMKGMVPDQQAYYLPVVPLEPWERLADLQTLARVHSFHKNGRHPLSLSHKIDNVA
jgi:hypothetical protein